MGLWYLKIPIFRCEKFPSDNKIRMWVCEPITVVKWGKNHWSQNNEKNDSFEANVLDRLSKWHWKVTQEDNCTECEKKWVGDKHKTLHQIWSESERRRSDWEAIVVSNRTWRGSGNFLMCLKRKSREWGLALRYLGWVASGTLRRYNPLDRTSLI